MYLLEVKTNLLKKTDWFNSVCEITQNTSAQEKVTPKDAKETHIQEIRNYKLC